MATWMSHFRVAQAVLDILGEDAFDIECFAVGNIAPDCGVPNPDGKTYTPDKNVSHYGHSHNRDYKSFREKYLKDFASERHRSFYIGYYVHLIADEVWSNTLLYPKIDAFASQYESQNAFVWRMKSDWRKRDDEYILNDPDLKIYKAFCNIKSFDNCFLDFFPKNAFEIQLERVRALYSTPYESDYSIDYLSKDELDKFVINAAAESCRRLKAEGII